MLQTEWLSRSIYTIEQLAVDKYATERQRLRLSLQSGSVEYKKITLQRHLRQKSTSSAVILNDFTQFIYFIEETDSDFELLEKALNKLKTMHFDNLRKNSVGPILMKMLYHFRRDDIAQKVNTILTFFFYMKLINGNSLHSSIAIPN